VIGKWRIEGDEIRNPRGEIVALIVKTLPAIQRQELVKHVVDGARLAYLRGREDVAEELCEPVDFEGYEIAPENPDR
jgi:hypothetical protein